MTVTKTGHVGLERAIDKFEKMFIREVKRIIAETAEMIAAQAKSLAPVDEGNLRDSINVEYDRTGLSAKIIVGAAYAIFVNYGTGIYSQKGTGRKTPWTYYSPRLGRFVTTRGMRAQMFWEPAVEMGAKHFNSEMDKIGA